MRPYHNRAINLVLFVGLLAFIVVCFIIGQSKVTEANRSTVGGTEVPNGL